MTSAHTKGFTYSPTNVGMEQEQNLPYLPSAAQAGLEKIKAGIQDGKIQAMPKLGRILTKPQGVTSIYWQITNKRISQREEGWEILKLIYSFLDMSEGIYIS